MYMTYLVSGGHRLFSHENLARKEQMHNLEACEEKSTNTKIASRSSICRAARAPHSGTRRDRSERWNSTNSRHRTIRGEGEVKQRDEKVQGSAKDEEERWSESKLGMTQATREVMRQLRRELHVEGFRP
jgi:hypothetical protein